MRPHDADILIISVYDKEGGIFKSDDDLVGSGKYNIQKLF